MRFYTTPAVVKHFFPRCTWSIPSTEKVIYLTFDDGPIPQHTLFILNLLDDYNAKATFFCVGDNIRKNTEIGREVLKRGHKIGNHTYHHLQAWKTERTKYLHDVELFEKEFSAHFGDDHFYRLFRPPHGQITPFLYKALLNKGYRIIMWDLLSYDFDHRLNVKKAANVLRMKTTNGSIVVFHDNYKAGTNLRYLLPDYLSYFSENGYVFKSIE